LNQKYPNPRSSAATSLGAALLAIGLALLGAAPAHAQGALSKAFPNGAQRGTTVDVTFAGSEVPDDAELVVDGAGLKGVGPFKKGVGKVEVAPDAAPGVRQLRLAGPKGVTSPRPFAIGALAEVLEKEPNGTPIQAQRIESLPVTINGVLPTRGDLDLFAVKLMKGECLVIAGESRALGAPTNLLARVRTLEGQALVQQVDHRTRDPLLGFTAPADGDYIVELQDVLNNYSNVNADYVYRVTLTKGPWLDAVFPAGAQRGKSTRLRFTGWNLGATGPSSLETDVEIPADAPAIHEISAGGAANRLPVVTATLPEVTEVEPNGGTGAQPPQRVTVPTIINGAFRERSDSDRFIFTARKGESLRIDVDARQIGSYADPILVVRDASGASMSTADDSEGGRDPRLTWSAPADGDYVVSLRDIAGISRGGPEFFYRLSIAPPAPELRATIPDPTLVLGAGKTLELTVKVRGTVVPGPVVVTLEGLPAGVTAAPVTVGLGASGSGSADAKLTLTAAVGASPGCTLIRCIAKGGGLTTSAAATWVLSTDRSGDLAKGITDRVALLVPAP